jgi:hypothetical protein
MYVKKLGRIPLRWRLARRWRNPSHPLFRVSQNGHSMVDDHSRRACAAILPDENGVTYSGFLARAAAYFADHGITPIEQIMTNNAWAYRSLPARRRSGLGRQADLHQAALPLAERQGRETRQALQTEWAYRQVFTANTDRTAALAPWLGHYNTSTMSPRPRRHLAGQPTVTNLTAEYT